MLVVPDVHAARAERPIAAWRQVSQAFLALICLLHLERGDAWRVAADSLSGASGHAKLG